MWALYNTPTAVVQRTKPVSNDIDDAIDGLIDPTTASNSAIVDDEFTQWKQCKRRVEKDTEDANNLIKY